MEKGTIGLLIGGGLAVGAFLSLNATHDTERVETRARIERDSAEIDKDFAELNAGPNAKAKIDAAQAKVDKAQAKLDYAEKEAEERRLAEQIYRDNLRSENAPGSFNKQREKLSGQGEALAKTLNK